MVFIFKVWKSAISKTSLYLIIILNVFQRSLLVSDKNALSKRPIKFKCSSKNHLAMHCVVHNSDPGEKLKMKVPFQGDH